MFNPFRHKCQFCGNAVRTTALRMVIKRTWDDYYNPKGRYRFHEECLCEALESEDYDTVKLALDVAGCIRREAQEQRASQDWLRMMLAQVVEASEHLEADLKELYG